MPHIFVSKKEVFAILVMIALALSSYNCFTFWSTRQSLISPEGTHTHPINDASEFRRLLSTVNALDVLPHSKTLGVASRLYVLGLPGREDRRKVMERLQTAMDIKFTWHNATSIHSPIVVEAIKRMHYVREESRTGHEKEFPTPDSFPFAFANDVTSDSLLQPEDISGSELWFLPPSSPLALPPLPPSTPVDSDQFIGRRPAEIANWHSHFGLLRRIADGDDDVAIVFEDDIDMEWDLERRLRSLWKFLPKKWDLVMLGHCFSREYEKEPVRGTSYLYPSTYATCAHAYAVSKESAGRLVRFLRSPLFAYSLPMDDSWVQLNSDKHIDSFSVYPPIVIQTSNTPSDVTGGMGLADFSDRQFSLSDSALERVRLWEARMDSQNPAHVRKAA